jgi:predicted Fe-Mo cluster-binding NifX family protein
MKIAVSTAGQNMEAQLDPRFGRCTYFLIIDTDTMEFEVFDNANAAMGSGAGIQAAQFVDSKGARAVITGNCGPKAMEVLSAAGIQVYTGQHGIVRDLVKAYQNGELSAATAANVSAHAGMGGMRGPGRGMGRAQGRGSGKGI